MVRINDHVQVIEFPFDCRNGEKADFKHLQMKYGLSITHQSEEIVLKKDISVREHIMGMGEKAYAIDRKSARFEMWNYDQDGYSRGDDPLYLSVPFFISVSGKGIYGMFVNSTARSFFDFGVTDYENITITIEDNSADVYIFEGATVEEVLEQYIELTGKPMRMPEWALSPQISRYSYYPEQRVLDTVDEYRKIAPVSAVYLDIDYMDNHKVFTWDGKRFPSPERLLGELHKRGVKLITIIEPSIKMEQGYNAFEQGLGNYINTPKGEIYSGEMWPGKSAFPDFLSEGCGTYWKEQISKFVETGVDGIWLDMNEPTVLEGDRTICDECVHPALGVEHRYVHNAYAYYQAKYTYEALKEIVEVPFILSRSGFSGIQKYAAVWTGDNHSTWDDLTLQISMVTSLGVSGLPFTGCDVGGFLDVAEPELIARYYQMAAFFPLYRNHNDKKGGDQELYLLPDRYREMAIRGVELRQKFLPYIISLSEEAHLTGHPVVRPLAYEFFRDENTFSINDEYMVGKWILFAPITDKGEDSRNVYLPEGKWLEYNSGEEFAGPAWITSGSEMPLFIRHGAHIPIQGGEMITYEKND